MESAYFLDKDVTVSFSIPVGKGKGFMNRQCAGGISAQSNQYVYERSIQSNHIGMCT